MKKIVLPILSSIVLIAIDQLTKLLARTYLMDGPKTIIEGVFELNYTENRGAAFGMLQDKLVLFIIITVIFLAALVFAYTKIPAGKRYLPLKVLAVFIFSGAIGNFIDRLYFGYVTDFLRITFIDFPVFNVADIYVSWSAVLAVILLLFKYKESDFKKKK